ncbi:MAG: ROK family protein [Bacteroidales bacterium]|nr:ROK family protein [Bacteroidales bacterium]
MAVLGIDIGGTKIASALFRENGDTLSRQNDYLEGRQGAEVGEQVRGQINNLRKHPGLKEDKLLSIGISVPGISYRSEGTVWAPNIPGWENYPLRDEVQSFIGDIPVNIDSDRACCMLGELWKGSARGCKNAIFLAVGTGIGAGILVNGKILRGNNDIAGSVGWMALNRPFDKKYTGCGCFEYHASGEGIAKVCRAYLSEQENYRGSLAKKKINEISAHDVMAAYKVGDSLAGKIIGESVEYWGMAVANLVSLFNPEKIIFGGGLFGPAKALLPDIRKEAEKWAQPISMKQVRLDSSALEGRAGVYGAAYLALKSPG